MVVGMSVLLTVAMLALVTVPAFEQEERNRISIKAVENMKALILDTILNSTVTLFSGVFAKHPRSATEGHDRRSHNTGDLRSLRSQTMRRRSVGNLRSKCLAASKPYIEGAYCLQGPLL